MMTSRPKFGDHFSVLSITCTKPSRSPNSQWKYCQTRGRISQHRSAQASAPAHSARGDAASGVSDGASAAARRLEVRTAAGGECGAAPRAGKCGGIEPRRPLPAVEMHFLASCWLHSLSASSIACVSGSPAQKVCAQAPPHCDRPRQLQQARAALNNSSATPLRALVVAVASQTKLGAVMGAVGAPCGRRKAPARRRLVPGARSLPRSACPSGRRPCTSPAHAAQKPLPFSLHRPRVAAPRRCRSHQ